MDGEIFKFGEARRIAGFSRFGAFESQIATFSVGSHIPAQRRLHTIVWVKTSDPPDGCFPLLVLRDGTICHEAWDFLTHPFRCRGMSFAWHAKAANYIGWLHDFWLGKYDGRTLNEGEIHHFFGDFLHTATRGTINTDGADPTGLFWRPRPSEVVRGAASVIRRFADHCMDRHNGPGAIPTEWIRDVGRAYASESLSEKG